MAMAAIVKQIAAEARIRELDVVADHRAEGLRLGKEVAAAMRQSCAE
jgi:hypothetical protein